MNLLRSIAMAFSMFSKLPMPRVEWKKENMKYMLAAYPLVGIPEALLLLLWGYLCKTLSLGQILFAAGFVILPILYTGGVHLDGFADTVDALSSHASAEKKRQILKDPHSGAFAVIYVGIYLLGMFALLTELPADGAAYYIACGISILSRAISALASLAFPVYGEEGLLAAFHGAADRHTAMLLTAAEIILCAAVSMLLNVVAGIAVLLAAFVCMGYVYCMSRKQFGGMSGDLAGFLKQIADISMIGITILLIKVGLI